MVVGMLRDPAAAAVDAAILERRSATRRRFWYLSIAEAVFNGLVLVGTFHTLAVALYVALATSALLIGAGIRHCMTDREMEKRRFCGVMGPLTVLTWLFRGRLVQLSLQPAAVVQLGLWVHDHPHRKDAGGVIAGMVLLVGLFSATVVQLCMLNALTTFAAVDQRITFAQHRDGAPIALWCPPSAPNLEPLRRTSTALPYGEGDGDGDVSLPAIALSIGGYGLSDAVLGTPLAPDGSPLRLQSHQPGLWRVSPPAPPTSAHEAGRSEDHRAPSVEDLTVVEASAEDSSPPPPGAGEAGRRLDRSEGSSDDVAPGPSLPHLVM